MTEGRARYCDRHELRILSRLLLGYVLRGINTNRENLIINYYLLLLFITRIRIVGCPLLKCIDWLSIIISNYEILGLLLQNLLTSELFTDGCYLLRPVITASWEFINARTVMMFEKLRTFYFILCVRYLMSLNCPWAIQLATAWYGNFVTISCRRMLLQENVISQ